MDILRYFAQSLVPPHILAIILGIPSGILYIFEVHLVFANRTQFNTSFFHLFSIRAITSIYNLFLSYFAPRFPFLGLFFGFYEFLPRICLNFFLFSSYYTFHVENLLTTALALNRLTAILYAMSYENLWKKLLPLSLAITFILPLLINYAIFQMNMQLYYYDRSNTSFGFVNGAGPFPNAVLNSYSTIAFAAICFSLNAAAWIALRQHNAKFKKGEMANNSLAMEHQRMELRLFIFSFCTFICQFVMAMFYFGIYLGTRYGREYFWAELLADALWYHFGLINDFCTILVPAWLMLWSSTTMRELLVAKLAKMKLKVWQCGNQQISSTQTQIYPFYENNSHRI